MQTCKCLEYSNICDIEYASLGLLRIKSEGKRVPECTYDIEGKKKCYCCKCTDCPKHNKVT